MTTLVTSQTSRDHLGHGPDHTEPIKTNILRKSTHCVKSPGMSITEDAAIRRDLHSAEVVQLYPQDTTSLVGLAPVDAPAYYIG